LNSENRAWAKTWPGSLATRPSLPLRGLFRGLAEAVRWAGVTFPGWAGPCGLVHWERPRQRGAVGSEPSANGCRWGPWESFTDASHTHRAKFHGWRRTRAERRRGRRISPARRDVPAKVGGVVVGEAFGRVPAQERADRDGHRSPRRGGAVRRQRC
jgi:hypothetical protein